MSIDVVNKVKAYEQDGKETRGLDLPKLELRSHGIRNSMVVLKWPNGDTLTVSAADLQAAIANATRTGSR